MLITSPPTRSDTTASGRTECFSNWFSHHNKQNQADNNQQNFWFQALIMFQGHFSCPPTVGNLQFRHNLAVAQAAIRMHLSDKPTGVTRCCRKKYTISPKAPIVGHNNEDNGALLANIARRVVSSLLKTTIWDRRLPLFTGIHKWVEWTLACYGADDAGEDRCVICLTADPVHELRTDDAKLCHHRYCDVCLPRWLARNYSCASCRQVPTHIDVLDHAYGWEQG